MKEQDIRQSLAKKLQFFRQQSGMTTADVGNLIGKSNKTVSGWEHGRGQPDADMLFRLCEIYHVRSISDFYPDVILDANANSVSIAGSDLLPLASEEIDLISCYRSLTDEGQTMLISTAHAFAGNPQLGAPPDPA